MIEGLRNLMRSWGWTETMIDASLPKIIEVCVEVGVLVPIRDDGFEVTDLVSDEGTWTKILGLLRERGIGGLPAG